MTFEQIVTTGMIGRGRWALANEIAYDLTFCGIPWKTKYGRLARWQAKHRHDY